MTDPVACLRLVLCTLLASAAVAAPAQAQDLPPNFAETTVLSGLSAPTTISFVPGGGILVAELSGVIKLFEEPGDSSPIVVANYEEEVYRFADNGLLGMKLDPAYPTRPYLYILYTRDAEIGGPNSKWGFGQSFDGCPQPNLGCIASGRLVRLELSSDETQVVDEQVLVEDWCQQFIHSVGSIAFDSTGALLVSGGDGASASYTDHGQLGGNPCGDPPGGVGGSMTAPTAEGGALRSQDVRTLSDPTGLSGSVIRVNPDTGAALPDNPLAELADPNARRIVAHGFRNPFRITVRPGTDELWVGDVGWSEVEEINRIPSDQPLLNFGWPCYEGAQTPSGYDSLSLCGELTLSAVTLPHFQYLHSAEVKAGDGCGTGTSAISGLAFESGSSFPESYAGTLFFADYARGCIWAIPDANGDGVPEPASVEVFHRNAAVPVDLQFGPEGSLYYVDIGEGTIRRIAYNAPTAVAAAEQVGGADPFSWEFDATASSDPNDPLASLAFAWDVDGDGYDDSDADTFSHTFTAAGSYTVWLKVTDPAGNTSFDSVTVEVANTPPVPVIEAPNAGLLWDVGDEIQFSGSATDEGQPLPASALDWEIEINHCPAGCHKHPWFGLEESATGGLPAPDHEYPANLELTLTATDPFGSQATTSVVIEPRTVDLTLASSPPGLDVTLDSASAPAPLERPVIAGSSHSISTTTPQGQDGSLSFLRWSDAGALGHQIMVDSEQTLTAFFEGPPVRPGPLTPDPLVPPAPFCNGKPATIVGTTASETLHATAGRDVIVAWGGSDIVRAGAGNDIVCAGGGPDTVHGKGGRDRLRGGGADDLLRGGRQRDRIDGGPGDDRCGSDDRDELASCP